MLLVASATPALATDVEQRIKFEHGRSSATFAGVIGEPKVRRMGEVRDRYSLGASKGQTMRVKVTASRKVLVYVWAKAKGYNDGHLFDLEGVRTSKTVTLPASDDYYIDIENPGSPKAATYKLTVVIR